MYAGVPSFFGLGMEDGHVPTFLCLLQLEVCPKPLTNLPGRSNF